VQARALRPLRHAFGRQRPAFAQSSRDWSLSGGGGSGLAIAADDEPSALWSIRLKLDDAERANSLRDFLRTAGCLALKVAPDIVEAHLLTTPGERRNRDELLAYISMWKGMHAEEPVLKKA